MNMNLASVLLERREFPVALAHAVARTPMSDQHAMTTINRLFMALSPADKLRCRNELWLVQRAKLGLLEAGIK